MDPLSVTAGIIAVLQLTSTVASYVSDARNATAEQQKVAIEASNLSCLLTRLRFRVEEAENSQSDDNCSQREHSKRFNQVKRLGIENGPLEQLKNILETMVNGLLGATL